MYLVSEEAKPLQEVLHQLELLFDGVPLHLRAQLLGLLAHTVLQGATVCRWPRYALDALDVIFVNIIDDYNSFGFSCR